jgi:hypothetical protein
MSCLRSDDDGHLIWPRRGLPAWRHAGWLRARWGCPGGSLVVSGIPPRRVGPGWGRRVELFAAIRFDWQRSQMSVRALARKYDVHRRTVRQALVSAVPPDCNVPARAAPVLDEVRRLINDMLREDLEAPRKQRHTARRVFERLHDEHDARVSYSYVAEHVHRRRPRSPRRSGPAGTAWRFVPQAKEPGAEAEAGFGDVIVNLAGEMSRCFMFAFRLSYSGRACHRVYASQAQEAFLEGHVAAFEVIGGGKMPRRPRRCARPCFILSA